MKLLPDPIEFEWDKGNIDKNRIKHGIENQEAEEVFANRPLIVIQDEKHSSVESRYHALGKTYKNKLLFLSFTLRGKSIRIISARQMNGKEEVIYEKA